MLGPLERSTIAKRIAKYIVEHLLFEPISGNELDTTARDVTVDTGGTMDTDDLKAIVALAVQYVLDDPRVAVQTTKSGEAMLIWLKHGTTKL